MALNGDKMKRMKEIQGELLRKVSIELSHYGFDSKIHGQSFWKPIEGGRSMVHLCFINHESDFDVTISASVRIDAIEDMINSTNKLLTKNEKQNTSTIGGEIGNLVSRIPKRYAVNDSVNLEAVTCEMLDEIINHAFPFFIKYSDLEILLETMIRDDKNVWLLAPLHHRRAQNAVALAKLLNHDNLSGIIESKRTFLESRKDYGLRMFNDFVKAVVE